MCAYVSFQSPERTTNRKVKRHGSPARILDSGPPSNGASNTGFSRPIVTAILERLGWTDSSLVDGVVASDEVRHGRPHADMIIRAMALSGVQDCKAVAKVGDTPSDLHEGAAAGCGLIIGVTNGTHTREQLMPHPHTHLIMSLEPLPKLILDTHLKPVVL